MNTIGLKVLCMTTLLEIHKKYNFDVDYDDVKETITDNQHLLDKGYKEQAIKNLNKLWFNDFLKDSYIVNAIVDDYLKSS